jgi:hypothetical protein
MAKASDMAADAEDKAAEGSDWAAAIKGVAAVASVFAAPATGDCASGAERVRKMAAIARALNWAFPVTTPEEAETFCQLALLAGGGLLMSLALMIYGADFGPELF